MADFPQLGAGRYAYRSLRHHWRPNAAVMLGVIVGTAVLTGALLVGDSVQHSLRKLTLERLGYIDQILVADHFFQQELVERLELEEKPIPGIRTAVAAILLSQTTVEQQGTDAEARASQVTIVGHDMSFWALGPGQQGPERHAVGRQIVLNQPLADALNASVGDRVVVRLPKATQIAGDSPLGDKTNRVQSLAELEVVEIIPADGLGRFSLRANQATPLTAFLPLNLVQSALQQEDRINAVFVAGKSMDTAMSPSVVAALRARIRPTLEDAGLQLKQVELAYGSSGSEANETVFRYLSLSTDTMMFAPPMDIAVQTALEQLRATTGLASSSVLTYLANGIRRQNQEPIIAYSTVSAVESSSQLTPLWSAPGAPMEPIADGHVVLNSWTADELNAQTGDTIELTYFAPETTHGETQEQTTQLKLQAIVPLTEPASPYRRNRPARYDHAPTRANDPDLTPEVPGITDQESIDEWDPPFPFDYGRIRKPEDEDYWDAHRTTPKAFVSKETGERLWGSRFGKTTSYRIEWRDDDSPQKVREQLVQAIRQDPAAFGLTLLPVKTQGLMASKGTTPFNLLFLGFSFFIIASALMLVALLFRLSLEQRAREAGLLMSVGLSQQRITRLFLIEGLGIALIGVILGSLSGIAYALLMILGLRTWWIDAVVTPFLELHIRPLSLAGGAAMGLIISLLTIRLTVAALRKTSLLGLLAGQIRSDAVLRAKRQRLVTAFAAFALLMAVAAGISAAYLEGEAQAGAFFGGGAGVLIAMLLLVSQRLKRSARPDTSRGGSFGMPQLVVRNVGRNPGRSTLTMGLMATACFLIVAISAFRLAPTEQGTGGFPLLARTDTPIFDDLNVSTTRRDVFGSSTNVLEETQFYALRMKSGDDASCRNLYQAQQPQVLGMPPSFIARFDKPSSQHFGWASTGPMENGETNPWRALNQEDLGIVPVILDKNTAMYSLHLYGGVGEEFDVDYESAGTVRFRVVGLLSGSVFQGSLLVSERHLLRQFPDISGYQFFAIDCPAQRKQEVARLLEKQYRDQGWTNIDTRELLADLLAVQNTYLSTFQSLGGLGLLLGTFGLAAVQLRSVFERRAELALLRATGFSQKRLGSLILWEHATLLLSGLGIGVLAALLAVIPHAWSTEVRPPWETLFWVLIFILTMGLLTGYLALRPLVRAPLMHALRGR